MQTSKIIIGNLYAVRAGGKVVRFKAKQIETRTFRSSKKASPADTTNTIHGEISEGDLPDWTSEARWKTVSPEDLLGDYQDWADLKEKQDEEERAHQARVQRMRAVQAALQKRLYEFTGIHQPQPGDAGYSKYSEPIQVNYGGGVSISEEASAAFLEALNRIENPYAERL